MGITFVVVAVLCVAGLIAVLYGLVNRRRSILLAVVALLLALTTGGGAWYAWAESQSMPWTAGYGAIVVVSLIAAIRQFIVGTGPTSRTERNGG
ncbi:MAG TPA: hypothetical protein VMM76_01005 [Pirellulaceae bacterium]|nr:hypothetical protein [Pirellulaceae bacterium]